MKIISNGFHMSPYILCMIAAFFILFSMVILEEEYSLITKIICVGIIVLFGVLGFNDSKNTYKVILKDMTYEELATNYKIVGQDGQVYEIIVDNKK